jgi:acetyl/propionyl-CoA carboxylase alpha subunit
MLRAEFVHEGETLAGDVEKSADEVMVRIGDQTVALKPCGRNLYSMMVDGRKCVVAVVRHKESYFVDVDSVLFELKEPSSDGVAGGAGDQATAKDKVFAPMPGKIVKIMVAVGDEVELKQPLVIVEAMKMENQVNAKAKGKVKKVNFAAGDQVDTEKPIIELEIAE